MNTYRDIFEEKVYQIIQESKLEDWYDVSPSWWASDSKYRCKKHPLVLEVEYMSMGSQDKIEITVYKRKFLFSKKKVDVYRSIYYNETDRCFDFYDSMNIPKKKQQAEAKKKAEKKENITKKLLEKLV